MINGGTVTIAIIILHNITNREGKSNYEVEN